MNKKLTGFKISADMKSIFRLRSSLRNVPQQVLFDEMLTAYFLANPITEEEQKLIAQS